jgi:hypothetical protein
MLSVVVDEQARAELVLDLDELVREGARRMLAVALEAEVDAYLGAHAELVDADGHRLVVRNGHAPARQLATAAGQVEVVRPRVDDRRTDPATGQRMQFHSVILPRWCRRSPKVAEVLPLLYLHGAVELGLRAGVGGVLWRRGGTVGLGRHPVVPAVAGRAGGVPGAGPSRPGLRVLLGGRHPLQPPAGRRAAVLPGDRGRARRRHQGAGGGRRRHPRVDRRLGRAAARPAPPRHARPGGDGRRRGAGAVAGATRGVPRHPRTALLGP